MNPYAVTTSCEEFNPSLGYIDYWKFAFVLLIPVGANQFLLTLGSFEAYVAFLCVNLLVICCIFRRDAAKGMRYAGISFYIWSMILAGICVMRYNGMFPLYRLGLEPIHISRFLYAFGHSFGLWLFMHPIRLHGIIKN